MRFIYFIMLFCPLLASCSSAEEETPEYPDENFSIVGTWEYDIPPCIGFAPSEGYIYNASGYITFTDDNRFSFTIDSDNGPVKGYGTYTVDEDLGVYLVYTPYKEIETQAREEGYIHYSSDIYQEYISWGNYGDRVEEDYMLVHSVPVKEYRRINDVPDADMQVSFYRASDAALEDDWYFVSHSGTGFGNLPNEFVELYAANR